MRILSIDGGGIRGIYAAHMLKRIASEFGVSFCEDFDLIVGASTGAIIAAALAIGCPPSEVVELYERIGKKIFNKRIGGILGVLKSRYDNQFLRLMLNQMFGERTMSDTLTRLMIPSTDMGNGQVFVFKSNYLDEFVRDTTIKISDAVLASCAAPTYFDPVIVKEYLLADGGLWANNPSMAAIIEATGKLKIPIENIKLLSIGTGIGNRYYTQKDADGWLRKACGLFGLSFYGPKIVEVILNLQSKSIQNMLGLLLREDQYLRLNFESDNKLSLDDVDTMGDLLSRGDHDFTYNAKAIDYFLRSCRGG